MRCDACLSSSNKQSQTKARRARPCIVSVYKYTRRPAIRNAGAKAINLCAATGQRACEWLLGCLRCVALQRTLTDGEESKMEAYAAGAKFDCLLFGEDRTIMHGLLLSCSFCLFACCACHSSSDRKKKNASGLARADMDDTLYPLSLGINLACRKNIQGKSLLSSSKPSFCMRCSELIQRATGQYIIAEYMLNKLRIEESQVPRMCLDLYREYGTTMAGLKVSELLGFGGASVLFRVVWIVVIVCSCRVLAPARCYRFWGTVSTTTTSTPACTGRCRTRR